MTPRPACLPCRVRQASPQDVAGLLALCAEHAQYERAEYDPAGKGAQLHAALFRGPPRLHAWVAQGSEGLVGYATAAREFSTWAARDHLHLDCLYLCAAARGSGIGARLLDAVIAFARAQGFAELQWQTPDWNVDAIRFYRRHGGVDRVKRRFALALSRGSAGQQLALQSGAACSAETRNPS